MRERSDRVGEALEAQRHGLGARVAEADVGVSLAQQP